MFTNHIGISMSRKCRGRCFSVVSGYALQKVLIITCWLLSAAASGPFIAFNSLEFMDIYYMIGVQHVPQCDVKIDWKVADITFTKVFAYSFSKTIYLIRRNIFYNTYNIHINM